jgi:hypothetical protein
MTMYARTSQLGFLPAVVAPVAGIPGVNIVLGVAVGAVTLFSLFKNWFQRGELKRQATAKAEDFVRAFYALADGRWPIPEGLPIVPGGTTFSRESVAGLIENCSLVAASSYLDTLERQLIELARAAGGRRSPPRATRRDNAHATRWATPARDPGRHDGKLTDRPVTGRRCPAGGLSHQETKTMIEPLIL